MQLLLEPVHATALDGIFQPGIAPVRTIPEIPLNLDDLLGHPYRLIRETKANVVGYPGKGRRFAMGHPQTASDQHVVSDNPTILDNPNEAKVVGKDVDVVTRRKGDCYLEFAGKIGFPVNRLDCFLTYCRFLSIQPNFGISRSSGREVIVDFLGQRQRLTMQARLKRIGGTHDVSVHVPASCQGIKQSIVDFLHRLLEVSLKHAVQLESLTGG